MTPDEFIKLQEALKEAVAEQVKITVNGKIERLLVSHGELKGWFEEHAREDKETARAIHDYIRSDEEWKVKAKPVIELGENISWSGTAFLKVLGAIGTLVAVIAGIINFTKHN